MAISRDFSLEHHSIADRRLIDARTKFTFGALGMLLAFLLATEINAPGTTRYLRYMAAQTLFAIVVLAVCNHQFRATGGVSWFAHLAVIATIWVDSLGNVAGWYARFVDYDKITHFLGGVMLTALAADIIRAVLRFTGRAVPPARQLAAAVLISVTLGGCWEVYEYLGDVLFHTVRHDGSVDTSLDLIMDTAGSLVAAAVLWRSRFGVTATAHPCPKARQVTNRG